MADLDFKTAFKYPFNKWKRLFNILWVFLPIFGWFAIMGYQVRLVREWVKGKYKELPAFSFSSDMKLGFRIFIRLIPLVLVIILFLIIFGLIGEEGILLFSAIIILSVPILAINLFVKGTVASSFEFDKVAIVFNNLWDYIVMLFWSFVLALVYLLMSIILVGIPASTFTKNIFIAEFYRKHVK